MPIDTKHRDYIANEARWELCRDFSDGEISVKNKSKQYLPGLSGQTVGKYTAYRDNALFFNASGRTVSSLTGLAFSKDPAVTLPSALEYLREDANGSGITLTEMLISGVTNILKTGRAGLLADREGTGKPYLVLYNETDVTNWDVTGDDQFVVLREFYDAPSEKDKYTVEEKTRYRELRFKEGKYSVVVWEQGKKTRTKTEFTESPEILPTKGGKPLDFVPFTIITPNGLDFEVDKSPIEDMCRLQQKHYFHSAGYSSALHTICLPTPVLTGFESKDEDGKEVIINLGPDTALVTSEIGAKATFLEFKGGGIDSVKDALTKIEGMLAALGAKLIEPTVGNTRTTAQESRQKATGEAAVMSSIITSVELAAIRILKDIAKWEGADPDEVKVTLNRELVRNSIDANMLIALTQAVQSGTMSPQAYYANLSESGFYEADSSYETEKAHIDQRIKEVTERAKAAEPVVPEPSVESATQEPPEAVEE